jgi:hypothetical protein
MALLDMQGMTSTRTGGGGGGGESDLSVTLCHTDSNASVTLCL